MQRRDLNALDAPLPLAGYTQAIEVSAATRTLYISGQVGQRMDGTIPDDIAEQSRPAWRNLEAQLKAAGMTLDSLVKVTTILPDQGDVAAAREGRSKVLGDRKPASTLIVGGLANPIWKIEVEGIVLKNPDFRFDHKWGFGLHKRLPAGELRRLAKGTINANQGMRINKAGFRQAADSGVFQHRVMGGSSSTWADRIGEVWKRRPFNGLFCWPRHLDGRDSRLRSRPGRGGCLREQDGVDRASDRR
jgi:enamine deaminase RidA (YjgF/YER057c/UK114 family)